jgi:peptidoglycan/LPS O-acetylase OafA/YrhL
LADAIKYSLEFGVGSSISLPIVGMFYIPLAACIFFLLGIYIGDSTKSGIRWPLRVFLGYVVLTIALWVIIVYGGIGSNSMAIGLFALVYLAPWLIFFAMLILFSRASKKIE